MPSILPSRPRKAVRVMNGYVAWVAVVSGRRKCPTSAFRSKTSSLLSGFPLIKPFDPVGKLTSQLQTRLLPEAAAVDLVSIKLQHLCQLCYIQPHVPDVARPFSRTPHLRTR